MSRMQAAREAAGLSVAYVADQLARHPQSITRWEQGQHTPPRACLVTMAQLYGVPVADLVDA
jgi:ribosome-binding protein aMBF1 (putative translation factor)